MARHGRYTIIRKLANGGMAEIFLAKQQGAEGFQKPVVLKRILSSVSADPQFRNMLIDEAHISMSLQHSNIVQVLDLGQAGGRTFLVLELVDGWDLSKLLHRARAAGRRLPFGLGMFVATEICRALAYAHAKTRDGEPLGIVHRDVSPNNVLISDQGEVKLADFGIAKAMGKRENTGTGVVKGKVAFMSPEQALGKALDLRSDLFSLGSLIYTLMVGQRPFDAATDLETLLRVQRADFKHPAAVRPDLEAPIASIIERAMMLEPRDRYQSADEMLVEMERVLRRIFGGIGQTELKMWLVDLGRVDNAPTIANQKGPVEATPPSGEMMEGKAVELGDARVGVDAEAKTSLAVVGGTPLPTPAAHDRDPAGDSWVDAPIDLSLADQAPVERSSGGGTGNGRARRRGVEELTLPEGMDGAEEAPPVRMGAGRRGRSSLWVLAVLAALGGGGYAGVRKFGFPPFVAGWFGQGTPSEAGAAESPALDTAKPSPTVAPTTASPAVPAPAKRPASAVAAAPGPGEATDDTTPKMAARPSGGASPAGSPSVATPPSAKPVVAKSVDAAKGERPPQGEKTSKGATIAKGEKSAKAPPEKALAHTSAARNADKDAEHDAKARGARGRTAVDDARERVKRLTQSPDYVPPPSGGEAPLVPSPP